MAGQGPNARQLGSLCDLRLRLRPQAPPPADGHEGPAGRQGRQPRRDDLGARAAGAARASRSPPTRAARTCTAAGRAASTTRSPSTSPSSRRRWAARLGDPIDPLLVSVRSGAKFSMPGMMDTVLNLGLNDKSREGPRQADRRRALRLRLLPPLHLDVRAHRARHRRGRVRRAASRRQRPRRERRPTPTCPPRSSPSCATQYKDIVKEATGKPFPQDPTAQLRGAIEAVFRCWNGARAIAYRVRERISHDLGTAVNVQAMVFGNRDDNSGTGVGFTRNAATGENKPYGDFLVNAQGEDVVAGIRNTEDLDDARHQVPRRSTSELLDIFDRLERTTATCATPSSPSSRASSGCCRPASASAPAPPRCAWPST